MQCLAATVVKRCSRQRKPFYMPFESKEEALDGQYIVQKLCCSLQSAILVVLIRTPELTMLSACSMCAIVI
eukprot:1531719-Amphidinium_carterae.1